MDSSFVPVDPVVLILRDIDILRKKIVKNHNKNGKDEYVH